MNSKNNTPSSKTLGILFRHRKRRSKATSTVKTQDEVIRSFRIVRVRRLEIENESEFEQDDANEFEVHVNGCDTTHIVRT